jgi:hypothetical protein
MSMAALEARLFASAMFFVSDGRYLLNPGAYDGCLFANNNGGEVTPDDQIHKADS